MTRFFFLLRHVAPPIHVEATLQRHIADLESLRVLPLQAPPTVVPAEEVRRLRKERDDLKDAVCSFETQLLDIQMDTKILAEDRDNFRLLYQQVPDKLAQIVPDLCR